MAKEKGRADDIDTDGRAVPPYDRAKRSADEGTGPSHHGGTPRAEGQS
ncbi:hypothetical protein P3L51_32135 [Streptomyces sp. PSRA5]